MNAAEKYIKDVLSGKQIAGRLVRLAVERHQTLFVNGEYLFDKESAIRALRFFSSLRHTSGEYGGKPFTLLPWQAFLLWVIFGWKRKDGTRLFTKVYVEVARKNGKSELAGALGLYLAFYDKEFGAEVYSAANTGDQAAICWSAGSKMAKMLQSESEKFKNAARVYDSTNNRNITGAMGFFRPVAADSRTLDGLRPHGAIIDEYHEAPDDSVLRVMESGMVNRRQPLLFVITTAGFNVNGPCYQYRKTIVDILEGRKDEPGTFGLIYTLDEGDDWNDVNVWYKANPSAPQTPTLEGLHREYSKAKAEGASAEVNFRTKNLNQWLTTKTRWISDDVWMKNAGLPMLSKELQWWAGLDLASTRDITAFVCFSSPDENGVHHIATFLFCPEENAKERAKRDGVPYLDWANDGVIELTPGNVADQEYMRGRIIEVCNRLGVTHVLYDPWNASQMAINLQTDGVNCEQFQQTTRLFNEPIKYIEKATALGNFAHGGHAALRWMVQNVNLYIDGNGNAKINKGKSNEKVDGVVALAMAVGGYLNNVNQQSVYITENRGLITL